MKAAAVVSTWIKTQYAKYGENQTIAILSKYLTPDVASTVVKYLVNKGVSALCIYLAAQFPILSALAGPVGTVVSKILAAA